MSSQGSVDIPSDLSLDSVDVHPEDSDVPASTDSETDDEDGSVVSEDSFADDEEVDEESSGNESEASCESESSTGSDKEKGVADESDEENSTDLSFVTDMSSDCSDEELPEIKKKKAKRARRGGFRKGYLKQQSRRGEKKKEKRSVESGSGHQSEGYTDDMEGLLSKDLDADGMSCSSHPETVPSDMTDFDDAAGGKDDKAKPTSKKKKRKVKKTYGPSKKYEWQKPQKASVPAPLPQDSVDNANPSPDLTEQQSPPIDASVPAPSPQDSVDNANPSPELDEGSRKQGELHSRHPKDLLKTDLQNLTEQQLPPNESLKLISQYLKLTLDDVWTVSVVDGVICLCTIGRAANPVVERSITWDGSGINFLVHSEVLPSRSILWQLKKPDVQNFGEVADFLTKVSSRFLSYEVCPAVQSRSHLWAAFIEKGHAQDMNSATPTLRSKDCRLISIYPGQCRQCRHLETSLREKARQMSRTATAKGGGDQSKINNRYLPKQDLEEKLAKVQAENKLTKQTVRRLRKRIDTLIKQNNEKISKGLSSDFAKIMNENVDKMSGIEKIFWEQQSIALSKRGKAKSMRWHPSMIRLALHLRCLSPAAYDFVRGFISLPSQRRLYDYSQFTDIKEGISKEIQEEFKKLIKEQCTDDNSKYFLALLDEMTIRSDLVYSSRTGELVGFTKLTSLEEELSQLEAEIHGKPGDKKLAKKILVFMLTGAVNTIKFIAAIYSTDDLTASQLYVRAWDVIYFAEDAGAKILAVIFDGASVNRKFIQMHFNAGEDDLVYCTVNPASGELRPLFFMLDTPHLLKTFRNCFANSGCHRNSRYLVRFDQEISWKAIQALYEILQKMKFKLTKLTKAHVNLTSFSCMKVFLAVQVLSKAVAEALKKYKDMSPLKEYYSEELVNFILMMNRCFDCLNGAVDSVKKETNPDLLEYTSVDDPRLDFLENEFIKYLEDWENYVKNRPGNYSKDQRSRMTISQQSLEGMKITIHSFVKMTRFLIENGDGKTKVSARRFGQDALEQFFAEVRRAGGSDNNPTLKQSMHYRLVYLAMGQQVPAAARKGNTESFKRAFEPDETPLAVRKKSKKN